MRTSGNSEPVPDPINNLDSEQALRDREQMLSLAEKSAGIGVWDAELATGLVRGTSQFFKIMGLPPSQEPVPQDVFRALRHPEDRDRVLDGYKAAIAAGANVYETEYRIIRPDGKVRWIFGRGRVVRDSQGHPVRYSGVDVDITERKEAEARLNDSEQRLRQALDVAQRLAAIVEASRDAIWSWSREAIVESWNAEAARLFQYAADEIIGQSLFVLVPPEGVDRAQLAIKALLNGASHQRFDTVRLRKDRSAVPVELTIFPVKVLDGEVAGFATICRDVSTRVRQEEALRASETRYRSAVVTGRIGAWETNMVTRTRTWTAEGMQLFGLNLADGRGTVGGPDDEFKRALHPEDKHMMEQFHRTADEVDSYPCEYRIVHADGRTLWVSGRGRVVARGPDGKAQLVDNMVMDITDRKKAEEQVQLLMRETAHRSKNLLTVVAAIAAQTGRGAATISEFQEKFSLRLRALAASQDLLIQGLSGGALLEQLVRQQLRAFAESGTGFEMTGPPVTLPASVTQTLGLALHELATNAAKYGAWSVSAGKVDVRWTVSEDAERKLHLTWTEHGGPPVEKPARKGFGHIVFEQMVAQSVDGDVTIEYRPTGLRWSLSLPIGPISEYGESLNFKK
jgi:PAS domain S-box-containing protein